MNKSRKHAAWSGAGLMLSLIAGSPAYADDVELMLSNPNSTGADKPNILFILDSSGSMTSIERTQEPYNSSTTYPGGYNGCSASKVYWTTGSKPPDCDTSRNVSASNFVCAFGAQQLAAVGQYSDRMAMYYRNHGKYKWRHLDRHEDALVECETDSGEHGDGTAGYVYARIGTDKPAFTDKEYREVDWGSPPTEEVVTVYSANFLNWYHNSPVTSMSRTDIVKTVTKNVLGSIQNANVGLMRFNYSRFSFNAQGGVVNQAIKDLDSNRSQTIAQVDALPAEGNTPLSETLYEAALYWRGMQPKYGGTGTDPDAVTGGYSTRYVKPQNFACAKNFIVLLTDGEPTTDTDANNLVPALPGFSSELGRGSCTGGGDGACLDDAAEYLANVDTNTDLPGKQTVATYTIGFTVDLPILEETARKGGGEYYLASDVQSLTAALTEIITNIFDKDISFTAPAVAVNAFNRTQHLNDLYISIFRAKNKIHWPGNLKRFKIKDGIITDKNGNPAIDDSSGYFADTAHSFWTDSVDPDGSNVALGGAANKLPDPSTRNVYTNIAGNDLTLSGNAVSQGNISSFTAQDFGLNGTAKDPTVSQMIDWARGVDVRDADSNPATTTRRAMGDTLHSQPASVVYDDAGGNMDIVVFTATNDGYLHAVDAETGVELWSFIPEDMLGSLGELYFDESVNYKHYGLDGDLVPVIGDLNHNGKIDVGTDFVYLVFGLRRGGNKYYALDITDKNQPRIKWIKSYPDMGQTWSPPVLAKVDVTGVNSDKAVLVIGGGYDTVHDQPTFPDSADGEGAAVYMLDLKTGAELWRAGRDDPADLTVAKMTRAIPSRIRVLDLSGDGFADRMYAVDIGGQLWRFDIRNGNSRANLVTGGVVASVGPDAVEDPGAADTRRFYVAPDVSTFLDENQGLRYLAVSFGSGYRSHPLNKTATDRFYSFQDSKVFSQLSQVQYNAYDVATEEDFVDVRGKLDVELQSGDRGWMYTLPPGEKVLAESQTFDDTVYFVSFEPQVASADPCQAGLSVNRLYQVNVRNGNPEVNTDTLDPDDPDAIDDARVTELEQGGIAPKPMFLFPSPDDANCSGDECAPPPIGCVGVECFNPGFNNNPVRTLWTEDGVE